MLHAKYGKKEANWCWDIYVEHTSGSQPAVPPPNTLQFRKSYQYLKE